jgi:psp operon transcriptional activator
MEKIPKMPWPTPRRDVDNRQYYARFAILWRILHRMSPRQPEQIALVGESPAFLATLEHVSRAAGLVKPVLVIGERGTGKELLASRLHYLSARWDRPLVKVNCAALTESLLESELFGHEAGAFTGATRVHIGRFEQADSGTLVLDELATISLRTQEKILRVIEYGEFQRVGGSRTRTTDTRIVGVSNQDLPGLDRLAFDVIHVPPLRARPEDIPTLAFHFAVDITSELERAVFPGFAPAAMSALTEHHWPGNVRELKNTVERSIYRAPDPSKPITTIFFDPFLAPFEPAPPAPGHANVPRGELPRRAAESARETTNLRSAVATYEARLLRQAMERCRHKQKAAAQMLGLSYHQLRRLLKKHRLIGAASPAVPEAVLPSETEVADR